MDDKFALELEQRLKKLGLQLTGHYPELRCGLFTLEVREGEITIWLGPKQERLSRCPVEPGKIAQRVSRLMGELGSHTSDEEFLDRLYQAYKKVLEIRGGREGDPVPIAEVLARLASLMPNYGRADLSYDLFRARDVAHTLGLHLVVATRAFTRRRQDFLWVPDDATGKGTVYSHLKFTGGEKMKKTIAVKQDEQAVEQADAQADAQASEQTQAIEKAWETLLRAGVITEGDRKALEQRRRDRTLLGLASETLAKAKQIAGDDNTVSVVITVGNWAYVADEGETRVIPRVTNAPRRTKAKSSETQASSKTGEASEASKPDAGDIPTEALKQATERLGIKWFGRANALRSKSVVALASQIASGQA